MSDQAKQETLRTIARGAETVPVERAIWRVAGRLIHVRFVSRPKTNGTSYAYNINPRTLRAEFELWICGDPSRYYLIPIEVIREIYNHPNGYVETAAPDRRVASVDTRNHRATYGGPPLDFTRYFRDTF